MADNVNTPSDTAPNTQVTPPPASSSSAPTVPDRPTNKPTPGVPLPSSSSAPKISRHRLVDYFRPDDGTPHVSVCVRVNEDGTVNLHVFDDGVSGYQGVVTNVAQGHAPGGWDWPQRV